MHWILHLIFASSYSQYSKRVKRNKKNSMVGQVKWFLFYFRSCSCQVWTLKRTHCTKLSLTVAAIFCLYTVKRIDWKFGFSSELISLCLWGYPPTQKMFPESTLFLQRVFRIPHCVPSFKPIFFHPIFVSFTFIMNSKYFVFQNSLNTKINKVRIYYNKSIQVFVTLAQRFAFGSLLPFKQHQECNFRFLNKDRFWIHHLTLRLWDNNMAVRGALSQVNIANVPYIPIDLIQEWEHFLNQRIYNDFNSTFLIRFLRPRMSFRGVPGLLCIEVIYFSNKHTYYLAIQLLPNSKLYLLCRHSINIYKLNEINMRITSQMFVKIIGNEPLLVYQQVG